MQSKQMSALNSPNALTKLSFFSTQPTTLAKRLSVSFDAAGGSGGGFSRSRGRGQGQLKRRGSSFDSHDDSLSDFDQYLYESGSESEKESEVAQ